MFLIYSFCVMFIATLDTGIKLSLCLRNSISRNQKLVGTCTIYTIKPRCTPICGCRVFVNWKHLCHYNSYALSYDIDFIGIIQNLCESEMFSTLNMSLNEMDIIRSLSEKKYFINTFSFKSIICIQIRVWLALFYLITLISFVILFI